MDQYMPGAPPIPPPIILQKQHQPKLKLKRSFDSWFGLRRDSRIHAHTSSHHASPKMSCCRVKGSIRRAYPSIPPPIPMPPPMASYPPCCWPPCLHINKIEKHLTSEHKKPKEAHASMCLYVSQQAKAQPKQPHVTSTRKNAKVALSHSVNI